MRIVTLNLNGIRSAVNKGFLGWLGKQSADVVCVQEVKAQDKDLTDAIRNPDGFHGHFHCADRPGYSGVGIYCRQRPRPRDQRTRHPRHRRRGPLSRGPLRQSEHRIALCPVGIEFRGTTGDQVQFHGALHRPAAQARTLRPRNRHLRRLERRAQGNRPQELALEPEELRLPARGTRSGFPA